MNVSHDVSAQGWGGGGGGGICVRPWLIPHTSCFHFKINLLSFGTQGRTHSWFQKLQVEECRPSKHLLLHLLHHAMITHSGLFHLSDLMDLFPSAHRRLVVQEGFNVMERRRESAA